MTPENKVSYINLSSDEEEFVSKLMAVLEALNYDTTVVVMAINLIGRGSKQ